MAPAAVRIEQSTGELDRVRAAFDGWLEARRASDELGAYRSQLATLGVFVTELLAAVREDAAAVPSGAPVGEVYDACREIDARVDFVSRFWAYFRERLDQRLGTGDAARTLRAADEVAWSCWAEPHRRSGADPPPVPMPYLQSAAVPDATLRSVVPYELRPADELLARHVKALPVPTIGLPEVCIRHPWWLVLVAHEVGHHLQHDLGGGELLDRSRALLEEADGGDGTWALRHEEVFADVASALAVGPAAAWALDELVTGPPEAMLTPDSQYPAPVERLALVAAVLDEAGSDGPLPPAPAWPGVDADALAPGSSARRAAVPRLAKALVGTELVAGLTLPALVGWEGDRDGARRHVAEMAAALGTGAAVPPAAAIRGARRAVAAGVAAWRDAVLVPSPGEPRDRLDALAGRLVALVAASREPGARAAAAVPRAPVVEQAAELTARLRTLRLAPEAWRG